MSIEKIEIEFRALIGPDAETLADGVRLGALIRTGHALLDELSRLREVERRAVTIKPLEWVAWLDGFQAHTPFGSYTVRPPDHEFGRMDCTWDYCFDEYYDEDSHICDSVDEGKAAAQAHWEDRISGLFARSLSEREGTE